MIFADSSFGYAAGNGMRRPGAGVPVGKRAAFEETGKMQNRVAVFCFARCFIAAHGGEDHRQMRIGVQVGEKIDPLCQRGEKILPVKQLCRFQVFRTSRQAVQLVERVPQPAELIDGVRPGAAQNPVDFPIGKPAEAFPDVGSQRAGQPQRLAVVQQARAVCQSLQNFMDGMAYFSDFSPFFGKEISRGTASFPLYNLQTERCLSVATAISFAIIRIGNLLRTETGERPERKLQALSVWGFCAKTGKEPCDTGNPRRGLFFGNAAADARSRQNAGSILCAPAAKRAYGERAER